MALAWYVKDGRRSCPHSRHSPVVTSRHRSVGRLEPRLEPRPPRRGGSSRRRRGSRERRKRKRAFAGEVRGGVRTPLHCLDHGAGSHAPLPRLPPPGKPCLPQPNVPPPIKRAAPAPPTDRWPPPRSSNASSSSPSSSKVIAYDHATDVRAHRPPSTSALGSAVGRYSLSL